MKRIILSILTLVSARVATAQEEYSRWSVTPKAGLTVATVVGDDARYHFGLFSIAKDGDKKQDVHRRYLLLTLGYRFNL